MSEVFSPEPTTQPSKSENQSRWAASLSRSRKTPVVILAIAAAAPLVASPYQLGLLAIWLPFALLAVSVDLLWGENRIVSFGHGAFFAAGGYVAGLLLNGPSADATASNLSLLDGEPSSAGGASRLDGIVTVLARPELLGVKVLPAVLAVAVCLVLGLGIGAVIFRTGAPELYAPLITLAVGVIATTFFVKWSYVGGSNGLSGIPSFTSKVPGGNEVLYWFNLGALAVVLVAYAQFRASRLGRAWRASGDDPVRLEALGWAVSRLRTIGFGVSAGLAGLAGALYAGSAGYVSPSLASIAFSVQILIWVAVGGPGHFWGPVLGALGVQLGQHLLSERLDTAWQLFLGVGLLVTVMVAPNGLGGLASRASKLRGIRSRTKTAARRDEA